MKELFFLFFHGKFRALFRDPTENGMIQFFRYVFVGGMAAVVDWALVFLFEKAIGGIGDSETIKNLAKYIAAVIGFCAGLLVNYFLSRAFVFNGEKARAKSSTGEFAGHAVVGVIGLGLTESLLLLGDFLQIYFMISKVIATGVVFFWNYFARKFFLYRKKDTQPATTGESDSQ